MKKIIFIISILLSFNIFSSNDGLPVDLTEVDAYVSKGFEIGSINKIPDKYDKNWIIIDANKGNRPLRVMDLFEGIPKRKPFSFGEDPMEFTFLLEFKLLPGSLVQNSLALYLAQIGENWEIFINGNRLKNEIYYEKDGSLRIKRSVRDQVIELPNKFLKAGANILAIRVVGDPTMNRTGLYMKSGYKIDFYEKLRSERDDVLDYMLFGIFLFFGLYHLLLFLRRRKDSFNFYFGAATILVGTYYVFRSPFIFDHISNTSIIKSFELLMMIYMFVFFMFFVDKILRGKATKFTKIFFIMTIIFSLVIIPFETEILLLWQVLSICGALYIFIYDILNYFWKSIKELYVDNNSKTYKNPFLSFFSALALKIPGNLFIGSMLITVSNIVDVYNVKIGNPTTYSKYSVFALVMGIVFVLANRFLNVHNAMEELNVTLEQKVKDRTKDLQEKSDELQAANEEMEAINENLTQTNHELVEAQEIAKRDMNMAKQVQSSFFPKQPPEDSKWDVAYEFRPMAGVSGDLYDFYYDKNSLVGISLLDVSGHGIASGLITLLARSVIYNRFMTMQSSRLNKTVEGINKDLISEIGSVDYYLTGIFLKFNDDEIEYVNAGHTDLMYLNSKSKTSKAVEPKDKDFKGHFLGIEAMQEKYNMLTFSLEQNDILLMYTDCLTESTNQEGEEFGPDRIKEALSSVPEGADAETALKYVLNVFGKFVGDSVLSDDLSVLVIRRK